MRRWLVLIAMLMPFVFAGTLTKPYTFTNNTTADATEVNSNFDTLYTWSGGNVDADNVDLTDDYTWTGTHVFSTVDLNGGALDSVIIGGTTPAAGTFTTLNATGGGSLTGTWTDLGTVSASTSITTSALIATTADINAGTVDATIGATTPAAGTFTTLNATGGGALTGTWTDLGAITTLDVNGGTIDSVTIGGSSAGAGTFTTLTLGTYSTDVEKALVPIGSIIPFYDFDASATFDSNYWAYCNGDTKTLGNGIGSKTLPDLSNRYLVGFGTEGGTDIGSATWATAAVGNASHQVDLSHIHNVDIASLTSGSESSHTHGVGTFQFKTLHYTSTASAYYVYDLNGSSVLFGSRTARNLIAGGTEHHIGGPSINQQFYTKDGTGTSGAGSAHSHSVDPPSTASTSGGSATQSIQPRSIRVRYIMRIK